ncbi:hypothetical protein AYO22_02705 [Fonsecaea multimorphosa]|nr:hypothetical protein AYO22_02705 [Fonsecaea multimorphosa]
MQMSWPYPLRSPLDPDVPTDEKDYDMTSPLFPDGSNFPCKNYQNDTDGYVTKATYLAGGTYEMWINGTVEHDGGSCQLSLSYDNGATFKVIKSMIGGCPLTHNYNFTIPTFAPSSDSALLSWSWFNIVGDREMYQNCARVQIVGGPSVRHRRGSPYRRQASPMDQLPNIFVCNVGNGCQTIERQEVVFPDPGTDVVYGQDAIVPDPGPGFIGAIPASAFTSQSVPYSTTTTTSDPASSTSAVGSTTVDPAADLFFTTTTATAVNTTSTSLPPFPFLNGTTSSATFATGTGDLSAANVTGGAVFNIASTTTSTVLSTTTTTSLPPFPLTNGSTTAALALSGTGAIFANLTDIVVFNLADSTTSTTSLMTTTTSTTLLTTMTPTTTSTTYEITNIFATTTTTRPTSSFIRRTGTFSTFTRTSVTRPTTFTTLIRFDDDDSTTTTSTTSTTSITTTSITSITTTTTTISPTVSPTSLPLPCVPGTFTCNDALSFSQCISTDSSTTTYVYMGSVALGMTCVNGQIIRENDGPCTPNGALSCNGDRAFYLCDQGGLIDMGPVAPGTICQDGGIVAAT